MLYAQNYYSLSVVLPCYPDYMKKEEIHLWDWQRILIGEAPAEFMLEVFIRTFIIYLLLLVAVRILGKRMSANITTFEMAVMLTLGAVVSVPMQAPDRGLLQGIVVLACVLVLHRGLTLLTFRSKKLEVITQGDVSLLVKNGMIDVKELKRSAMSHEQLFAQIRNKNLRHLGQVKRVYLEACGIFSIYENTQPKPGLSILPGTDEKIRHRQQRTDNYIVCKNCGNLVAGHLKNAHTCENCGANGWDQAVAVEDSRQSNKTGQHSGQVVNNRL
jgi:uncharacterized membrane protein YcaP (DUF421 family)